LPFKKKKQLKLTVIGDRFVREWENRSKPQSRILPLPPTPVKKQEWIDWAKDRKQVGLIC
jgi:hypothetical protein